MTERISHSDILQLKRWNTPTIYNGWEQITQRDVAKECFNLEETTDFMPQIGPMVGRAITVTIQPSNESHRNNKPDAWTEYRRYVANISGPKIVVVQDLDKPQVIGSFWGEVNSNIHRSLGCIGTITDGAIRDLDEMNNAGFKAIARRLCVGHAYVTPVQWGCDVDVFGCKIVPKQLIHADKHGFLAIPPEDERKLLEAAKFMDTNECQTLIRASRSTNGQSKEEILSRIIEANKAFNEAIRGRFGQLGDW
jgi:4-hydroxy-4-methyl-2-oxoglutarate aldolase